jgi:transcription antitermination factor NusG
MLKQTEHWIVVRSKSGRERWAAENISRQGFEFYFPVLSEPKLIRSNGALRRVAMARPLFPDYIFVRSSERWRVLLSTFGVMYVLLSGDRPATLFNHEVERLKSTELDGFVILPPSRFKRGQHVAVRGGAFDGAQGIYDGLGAKDRVKVLLDVLGRKATVLIADELLEAV